MDIQEILKDSVKGGASDLFIVAGLPVTCRAKGKIIRTGADMLTTDQTEECVTQLYALANHRSLDTLHVHGDDDFAVSLANVARFRVSAFKQRGSLSAVVRVVNFKLPDPKDLNIPEAIMNLSNENNGMILVTGPAGSGKSTTLACIINEINHTKEKHIITLEDPIEYLHRHNKSIVSQREVNVDTDTYVTALRAALRQSPDVILLGEMRDFETISVSMTAAETGHLIISTLHTIGAANTVDRIIDVFPSNQQRQIAIQLSMCLDAVVSQQLVPSVDGDLIPAFEIMTVTPAIRNMIRDNKIPQIDGMIYTSTRPDMVSMDTSLLNLYKEGKITADTAIAYATNAEMLQKKL